MYSSLPIPQSIQSSAQSHRFHYPNNRSTRWQSSALHNTVSSILLREPLVFRHFHSFISHPTLKRCYDGELSFLKVLFMQTVFYRVKCRHYLNNYNR
jgi:hypothetical protein